MKLGESIFQGLIYLTLFCFPPRKLTKCFIRILGGSFINNPASSCFTLLALYNLKGTLCLFFRASVNSQSICYTMFNDFYSKRLQEPKPNIFFTQRQRDKEVFQFRSIRIPSDVWKECKFDADIPAIPQLIHCSQIRLYLRTLQNAPGFQVLYPH